MSALECQPALPISFAGVTIRAGAATLLEDLSLSISAGPPTVIVGPNGAGKTTFLKAAMGLILPGQGHIRWGAGKMAPSGKLALVFQRPVMLRRSCAGNVRYALAAAGVARRERDRRIAELLQLVGLADRAERPARRLSGGEQQRLALARALARRPSVLLLDEPTASLDPSATKAVEDLVRSVAEQGVKVVMATHDLGGARRLAGEIILLHRGAIVESRPADEFFADPVTDAARRFIAGELLL
jgi:tungstate transport system ATP-binding protein